MMDQRFVGAKRSILRGMLIGLSVLFLCIFIAGGSIYLIYLDGLPFLIEYKPFDNETIHDTPDKVVIGGGWDFKQEYPLSNCTIVLKRVGEGRVHYQQEGTKCRADHITDAVNKFSKIIKNETTN